ncbi:MFS transporter [Catenovulum maritimum]|uniref:MFS transporter n=1 Tax=Catenovulum maritimum TaxID=1513271 RepID=A0A0J8JMV2_9ALTE|nr:MFS transporter [Catenovulum maritimum]KMT65941.1 MFS transporter [Catenovulum maritimum]
MSNGLTKYEKKIAAILASIFSLRMLGLFMIMPVMAVYGQQIEGFSPLWIGIVIGAYGLTQALLQIPMGLLSDKIGRRPVILIGLTLFAIGSLVAATADNIFGVAVGRFMQGTGAIASAVLALAADLTREEQRSKVMAVIGMCIGLSFAAAMVVGPIIADKAGLSGIFYVTAVLAGIGILLVLTQLPHSVTKGSNRDAIPVPAQIKQLIKHPNLRKLNLGVFFLHLQLTCLFVVVPGLLVDAGFSSKSHWMLYFPALLASFLVMAPMLMWAMKKQKETLMFKISIGLISAAMLLMLFMGQSAGGLLAALIIFFAAFNYLEANLPAWVSRLAPVGQKGSAMGVFSSCQFAGAFCGGLLGGVLLQNFTVAGVLIGASLLAFPWLIISNKLSLPIKTKPKVVSVSVENQAAAEVMAQELIEITGIEEAVVIVEEQLAYLKTLPAQLDEAKLQTWLAQHVKQN